MKGSSPKYVAEKWKKLMVLGQKQGSILLKDLAIELEMELEGAIKFVNELFPDGAGLEIYEHEGEQWVDINLEALQYMLPLSPTEWIHLHEVISRVNDESAELCMLKKKISGNGPIKIVMELLRHLEISNEKFNKHQEILIKQLEKSIHDKTLVKTKSGDEKYYNLFPCRILHLEGQLSLIAEDASDHCLVITPIKELTEVVIVSGSSGSKVSAFEVEEFIAAVRSMNERETRLILKIHDPQSVNLFPDYQFLGKPCMVTNSNGDLIWAAYVEPCHALFDWLMGLGKNVEILDPVKFKEEYLIYCEEKVRKVA